MNTTTSTRTANRIAAGVTATYLRNLSRHRTPSPEAVVRREHVGRADRQRVDPAAGGRGEEVELRAA
jgi:hypothetical protein